MLGWCCWSDLRFFITYWGDNVIRQVNDGTYFMKKLFFSFAQVFIIISKYSVRFNLICRKKNIHNTVNAKNWLMVYNLPTNAKNA